jgi:hypothetical protein
MSARRVRRCAAAVALILAVSGCGLVDKITGHGGDTTTADPPATTTMPTTTPSTTTPSPTPTPAPTVNFQKAVDQAVASVTGAQFALAVYDRQQNVLVADYQDELPFYTESVVKLLIGLDSLDRGGNPATVSEMLSRSDDNTADKLWGADGGVAIVTRMAAKIGLQHTTPPHNPGEWGDTRTTAGDVVQIYQYILGVAPAAERDVVVAALHAATQIAADGTDQYFGIPYAVGTSAPWAVKQGWACCEPGWVLNTTGLVGPSDRYIVVALSSHNSGGGSRVRQTDSLQLTAAVRALLPDLSS